MTPLTFANSLFASIVALACPNHEDATERLVAFALARVVLSLLFAQNFGESTHEIAHFLLDVTRESITG